MQIVKGLHSKEPAWESPLNHLQGLATTLHNSLWGRMSTASTFVCFQAWTWSLPLVYYSFTALAILSCLPYTSFTPGLQQMLELLPLWSYTMRKHVVWSIRSATLHLNWCDSTRWFILAKEYKLNRHLYCKFGTWFPPSAQEDNPIRRRGSSPQLLRAWSCFLALLKS
jgi:hypothetical protein